MLYLEDFFLSTFLMKQRVLAILILFALAIIGILAFTMFTLLEQEKDAAIIDVIGQQRMLNQRHLS